MAAAFELIDVPCAQDPMLDLLAGMAVEGWRAGQASAALGALALMSMLGVAGVQSWASFSAPHMRTDPTFFILSSGFNW